jgi:hypothetical protein
MSLGWPSDHYIDWEVRFAYVDGGGPGPTIVFSAGWDRLPNLSADLLAARNP